MEPTKRDFHHPFQPYNIQLEFMNVLYDCIENGKVGIFESPTGTGKSLSLICGSLTWLRDQQIKKLSLIAGDDDSGDEPAWVLQHLKQEKNAATVQRMQELETRLAKIRAKELRQKQQYEDGGPHRKRSKLDHDGYSNDANSEDLYLLDDYASADEAVICPNARQKSTDNGLSTRSFDLLNKLGMVIEPTNDDDVTVDDELKIFYSSRTHSQLTQFANEVKRVKVPFTLHQTAPSDEEQLHLSTSTGEVKYLSLGSRKNLCINPQVARLGNVTAINEMCLELQQSKTPQDKHCSFLPNKDNEPLVHNFRDHTLASVRDIEDLGSLGKKIGICPYYASRASIKPSEIVTLPYPLLLQRSVREALDISLKGHIVIIDEAHNLMDAISSLHSVSISLSQLERSRAQLGTYLQKFKNKLKGQNRVYVTQVVRMIDSLSGFLMGKMATNQASDGIVDVYDLMKGKGIDQINIFKLGRYLQISKLGRKVDSYLVYAEKIDKSKVDVRISATPNLTHIQTFLQILTNPAAEGRFFYSRQEGSDICLKYMLLDPTHCFKEVVEDARAVILAGGTMSPMDDYTRHLFSYLEPEHLKTLSCGHVIPDENLLAWPITRSPAGLVFDFTYEKRNTPEMISELGICILRLAQIVPDGLVVFFPSYAYLEKVMAGWKTVTNGRQSIWTILATHKKVFAESKGRVSAEDILRDYSAAIEAGKGGLLLSIIGGKMSEGINFSDDLGRGVVVVGLPFPNIESVEWKAKLEYVADAAKLRGESSADCKMASREFYENACMRAVNQSIGRAIRHQKDYATIIMLDHRYNTTRIQGKLPGWIKKSLAKDGANQPFSEIENSIRGFFEAKRA